MKYLGKNGLKVSDNKVWHEGNFNPNDKVDNSQVLTNVPANAKFTDTNTTYSEISTAEIDTGTGTTLRTITARRIKYILDKAQAMVDTLSGTITTALAGKVDNSKVLTNVPVNAKFTDTVTTINGKTGAISKADITGLGIPAQDTVYSHPTTAGNKHIPSGGASGQFLKWSASGTAIWSADNNTIYGVATTSANGLMSSADKTKLNGIETGANKYTLPVASTTIGGVKSGTDITVDTSGNVSVKDDSHNHIISNVDGLQTALDGKQASLGFTPANIAGDTFTGNVTVSNTSPTLTVKNTGGGNSEIMLDRNSNASWKLLNSAGVLSFQSDFTSVKGSYYDILTLRYSSGNATFKGIVTAPTFSGALSGNATSATSATKLTTSRTINGVGFDGSKNITITANPNAHNRNSHSDINQSLLTTDTVQFNKIGIGTSSPNESLDIVGNARIRQENSMKFGGVGASDSAFEIKYNATTKSLDFNCLL